MNMVQYSFYDWCTPSLKFYLQISVIFRICHFSEFYRLRIAYFGSPEKKKKKKKKKWINWKKKKKKEKKNE